VFPHQWEMNMDRQIFENHKVTQAKLASESSRNKETFFRHVLLVASSIFGILISLHSSNSLCLYIRVAFVFSVALLGCGILLAGMSLYDRAHYAEGMRQAHYSAVETAIAEREEDISELCVKEKKRTKVFETCSLALLFTSVLSLIVYAVLRTI
jgi:hypothetical protein